MTSRVIGYDQARLDDSEFTCYRLGGFRDEDIAEYAHKWFALDEGAHTDDADAFMTESQNVPDLRSNPLLLSLMCILYRGQGSLPRNRAEVYEQCANLLFRRWDARRRIHQELRAGHLLEPTLRHLAWWLFTRSDAQTAVTERELTAATAEFLHGRGFESLEDASEAAREFVEFSRGRMWVFSDAGTTAAGEKLYSFTHRTFLEYFAAAQLAYDSDTPEALARALVTHVVLGEWEVVDELAVQIKDSTSRDGAKRIYEFFLAELDGRSKALQFLARTLRSVDPSPQVTRQLTRETIKFLLNGDTSKPKFYLPFAWLLRSCFANSAVIIDELSIIIDAMIRSPDHADHLDGLYLAVSLDDAYFALSSHNSQQIKAEDHLYTFWRERSIENAKKYADLLRIAAAEHTNLRNVAVTYGIISVQQALDMNGGLTSLLQRQEMLYSLSWSSYLTGLLADQTAETIATDPDFAAVGRYLTLHPRLPWCATNKVDSRQVTVSAGTQEQTQRQTIDPLAFLGFAALVLILSEYDVNTPRLTENGGKHAGPVHDLLEYIDRRFMPKTLSILPELPVPEEFKLVFHHWAEGKVDFIGHAPDSADSSGR